MNFEDIINEELTINTKNPDTDEKYRQILKQVFTPMYLKKIDKFFPNGLTVDTMRRKNNVMAITTGTQITVNKPLYKQLSPIRANVYLIHETFHVLQNMPQFKELVAVNNKLCNIAMQYIPKNKVNAFLTGKEQNIHSDFTKEFLSYYSNNVFNWKYAPKLKNKMSEVIINAGIFNVESPWWQKRL